MYFILYIYQRAYSLLLSTLNSENQGLEIPRSISNPVKKLGLYYKLEKNQGSKPEKKSRFAEPEIFLGFEINLDFSRP